MADYAAKLKKLLRANQCRFERQGKATFASDVERVKFLFERYQPLTSLLPSINSPRKMEGKK